MTKVMKDDKAYYFGNVYRKKLRIFFSILFIFSLPFSLGIIYIIQNGLFKIFDKDSTGSGTEYFLIKFLYISLIAILILANLYFLKKIAHSETGITIDLDKKVVIFNNNETYLDNVETSSEIKHFAAGSHMRTFISSFQYFEIDFYLSDGSIAHSKMEVNEYYNFCNMIRDSIYIRQ